MHVRTLRPSQQLWFVENTDLRQLFDDHPGSFDRLRRLARAHNDATTTAIASRTVVKAGKRFKERLVVNGELGEVGRRRRRRGYVSQAGHTNLTCPRYSLGLERLGDHARNEFRV